MLSGSIHARTAPILQIQRVNVKLMFAVLTPPPFLSVVWYMYVIMFIWVHIELKD